MGTPLSPVPLSAILLLPTAGNYKNKAFVKLEHWFQYFEMGNTQR